MSKTMMIAPRTIIQLEIWYPAIDVFRLNHSMTFLPDVPLSARSGHYLDRTWLSREANISNSPNPPFGHVADLIACHRRKIITQKKLPYDGRRTGFCNLRRHFFEKNLALFSRVLNI